MFGKKGLLPLLAVLLPTVAPAVPARAQSAPGSNSLRTTAAIYGPGHPANEDCRVLKREDSLREKLPPCWFKRVAGWEIVTFKKHMHYGHQLSLDPTVLSRQLDEIKAQGIQAIEIFAPAEGHKAYNGLDTMNFFRIDPELGTMNDFRAAVRMAHSKNVAVVIFINLGYFAIDAPDWIEAQKDKAAGRDTAKTRWFLWSNSADAPYPPTQEDIYDTPADRKRDKAFWGWHYSELAHSYYWSRWKANGPNGNVIPLPQMNWGDPGWRNEAAQIVRFWMDTGIDGMLVDAPLCYPNQTWTDNRRYITGIVRSHGNVFLDPEGGRDQSWITEAGYDAIHDYGLAYTPNTRNWVGNGIQGAIETGDPSQIELRLRSYHDPIFYAGGVLYAHDMAFGTEPVRRDLQQAVMVGIGDIVVYGLHEGSPDAEQATTLHLKAAHPALFPDAVRRALPTNDDHKYYAFLKTAADGSERVLAVYNFQSSLQTVKVDMGLVSSEGVRDLRTGEFVGHPDLFKPVSISLPAYGYRFFEVLPPAE